MADWSSQFKSLLSSPVGLEAVRTLKEDLHDSIITDAEKSDASDNAFALLNQARGVIKAVEHLQSIAAIASIDEGSK